MNGNKSRTIGRKRNKRRVKHWRCAGTKSREQKKPQLKPRPKTPTETSTDGTKCRAEVAKTLTENRSVFGKTPVGVLDNRSGVENAKAAFCKNPECESGTVKHRVGV